MTLSTLTLTDEWRDCDGWVKAGLGGEGMVHGIRRAAELVA